MGVGLIDWVWVWLIPASFVASDKPFRLVYTATKDVGIGLLQILKQEKSQPLGRTGPQDGEHYRKQKLFL